ncbi:stage II sporulation protein M [Cryobacterium lactosi]|uniref:Stage II sporulation protein M n=1 Tax=Cryobacterium lactosi TaxID=1259202 RepID=A0A4R9BMJ9_9MICO|nr:stage II sporulation protein M [Cryobacterium lactosi]TFD87004.1 stage II sporulation protein M [Cryobacterium lactosi]
MTTQPGIRTTTRRTNVLLRPFQVIRENRRPFVVLNVALFGLLVAGFVVGMLVPELSAGQVNGLVEDGTLDQIAPLLGNVWFFALAILFNNAVNVGAVIVLPSLIVPFAGIGYFGYKVAEIGLTLAASGSDLWGAMLPHLVTVVVEIEAYVLLALGAYVLGRSWIFPRTVGASNRRRGYLRGLQQFGWLILPAFVLLVIGALYEAVTLIYVILPQLAELAG